MTTTNEHIIKTQEYRVSLKDRKEAFQIQSAISVIQESRINALLDDVMNKFSSKNRIYQFSNVELDLGVIDKSDYENELVYRIEAELTNFFKSNIRDNGNIRNGKRIDLINHKLEQFAHFLLYGYLKWNSISSQKPSEILEELSLNNKDELAVLLNKHGKKERVRKRLMLQFSEDALENMVNAVAKKNGGYIISYKRKIVAYQHKTRIIKTGLSSFRNAVWEIILTYIFVDSDSYFNKKSFLQYLIRSIAGKYNLTYKSLLASISKGVSLEQKLPIDFEFKKLILALSSEQKKTDNSKISESSANRQSIIELIDQVDHYLNIGTFSQNFQWLTKREFNDQLKILMQARHSLILKGISNWLDNPSKKDKFLSLLNEDVLDQMVLQVNISAINKRMEFIAVLENSNATLSAKTKALLNEISKIKARLILGISFTEEDVIQGFLKAILEEFDLEENTFLQLLGEVKNSLVSEHRRYLEQFLANHLEKKKTNNKKETELWVNQQSSTLTKSKGEILFEIIRTELEKIYLAKTRFSEWQKEVVNLLLKYSEQYKISVKELNASLIKYLKFDSTKLHIYNRLLKIKASGYNFKEFDTQEFHETEQFRNNIFRFVLDNGKLPWWNNTYSLDKFNEEFAERWKSYKYKKQIQGIVKKNKLNISVSLLLNDENIHRVWKESDQSPSKIHSSFFIELHTLINQQLIPINGISNRKYNDLKLGALTLILKNQSANQEAFIIAFLQHWLSPFIQFKNKSVAQLLLSVLNRYKRKISAGPLKNELNKWTNQYSGLKTNQASKKHSTSTINDFLMSSPIVKPDNIIAPKTMLIDQLEQAVHLAPKQFDHWLTQVSFRENLLRELDFDHLIKIINLKINKNQKPFLEASITVLKNANISPQEYKKILRFYIQLILLKLSSGGFSSWQIENWSKLVLHCLTHVLGKHKTSNVLLKTKEKQAVENSTNNNISLKMLNEIWKMAIYKSDDNVIIINQKKGNKSYKKLEKKEKLKFEDMIYINNAGLIILAPFLGLLFEKCALMEHGKFHDQESKYSAVHLLEYAATGESGNEEHELIINKLLCGMSITDPITVTVGLADEHKEIVESLLTSVTQQWSVLKNTSIDGLRTSFLQRAGKLEETDDQYHLKIEQLAFDMLLDQIPWNISKIKLSWMKKLIQAEWR